MEISHFGDKGDDRGKEMTANLPMCKCGCGSTVARSTNKFIVGHNSRLPKHLAQFRALHQKVKPLRKDEVPPALRLYHDFDSQAIDACGSGNKLHITVYCRECGKERRRQVPVIRGRIQEGIYTGLCADCNPRITNWRGGRKHDKGYVLIHKRLLSPEEQQLFASMYEERAYILEHRLIMARFLGRPLEDGEFVHHINGQRNDNRIENLQLVVTRAHKGELRCPRCDYIFSLR